MLDFKIATKTFSEDSRLRAVLGICLYELGHYDEAINEFGQVIKDILRILY